MIYRRRIRKSGYGVTLLPLHLKIEFGKRVLYIPFLGIGKPLHNLRAVIDRQGVETVAHVRRRDRVTIDANFSELAHC